MSPDTLKLYHSPASPNSRRARIFLAEKGLKIPLVAVDLGKGEQHSAWGLKPGACTKLLEDI